MKLRLQSLPLIALVWGVLALSGCSGGGGGEPPATYRVGGSVTGLNVTYPLTLLNNGSDTVRVAGGTTFQFGSSQSSGSNYAVTVATQPTGQICTVTNGSGSVGSANVTSVTVNCVNRPAHAVVANVSGLGASKTVELRLNTSTALSISANAATPFPSTLSEGLPYEVTVGAQPVYQTCTVANGSGTMSAADVTVGVVCEDNKPFALAVNWRNAVGGNTISVYEVDRTTGSLAPVAGSPFSSQGIAPLGIAVNDTGTHAFVTNSEDNTVVSFAISPTTGALTMVGTPVVSPGLYAASIAVNRAGTAAYVVHGGTPKISAFAITPATGALALAGEYNLGGVSSVNYVRRAVAVSPSGGLVFVGDGGLGNVAVWAVSAATGVLSSVGTYSTGGTPSALTVNATGTQLLVGHADGSVARMAIAASGALSALGTPITPLLSTHLDVSGVAYNPAGTLALVSHVGAGAVVSYVVAPSTGDLTAVAGNPFSSGGVTPFNIAINPAGTLALVSNSNSNTVSSLTIDAAGALALAPGSPTAAGNNPRGVAFVYKR